MSTTENKVSARVLIVDDEDDQRNGLASLVSSWGHEVRTARDGQDALEKLDEFAAHVMLTDLTMPGLTGADLARKIRAIRSDVPIILMAGYDDIAAPDRLFEVGVNEVLRKPLMAETLTTALHRVLQAKRQ